MTTDPLAEGLAVTIFWAAYELYPPHPDNPVARMTRAEAWAKTSEEHRRLARFQSQRVLADLAELSRIRGAQT